MNQSTKQVAMDVDQAIKDEPLDEDDLGCDILDPGIVRIKEEIFDDHEVEEVRVQ